MTQTVQYAQPYIDNIAYTHTTSVDNYCNNTPSLTFYRTCELFLFKLSRLRVRGTGAMRATAATWAPSFLPRVPTENLAQGSWYMVLKVYTCGSVVSRTAVSSAGAEELGE